jgi:nicotinamide-nucleotide amidase
MKELVVLAERVAVLLKARKETVAVAESSAGGLITAALLAVPGASAYCLGGAVIYTPQAWGALRDFSGATGPTGNRYGDPAGHACLAVSGRTERAMTLKTGSAERLDNMHAFTAAALQLFLEVLDP